MLSILIAVPQVFIRRDQIAQQLFEFLALRKTPPLLAAEDQLVSDAHSKLPTCAGYQREFTDRVSEGEQQLLRHPGRTQDEAALVAVADGDSRARHMMSVSLQATSVWLDAAAKQELE